MEAHIDQRSLDKTCQRKLYNMHIGILSRGPQLYSTQSLVRAAEARGHRAVIIDHTRCNLVLDQGRPMVYYDNYPLDYLDAIIPRIGSSVTGLGASVISHFELMGVATTTSSEALLRARNKLRSLQHVSAMGLPIPHTVMVGSGQDFGMMADRVGGLPAIVKLLEGTHGIGVVLVETYHMLTATIEAFQRLEQRVLIQEFIREAEGADIRAFFIDGEVVASMRRQARPGEFRSNLHRGASATPVTLAEADVQLVKDIARAMQLEVAGVDLIPSNRGLLVMEVNASPGLEGIEGATGVDVADHFIQLVERKVAAQSYLAANF